MTIYLHLFQGTNKSLGIRMGEMCGANPSIVLLRRMQKLIAADRNVAVKAITVLWDSPAGGGRVFESHQPGVYSRIGTFYVEQEEGAR